MSLPTNPSKSFIARNPHLYGTGAAATRLEAQQPVPDAPVSKRGDRASVKKRIRQSSKPLLNELEKHWLEMLTYLYPGMEIHAQSMRFKLANGVWYKPDFTSWVDGRLFAWEVKGPKEGKNVDRGMLALKCAAFRYPEIEWVLVWKERGEWKTQDVIP